MIIGAVLNESRREDDRMRRVGMLKAGVSGREDGGEKNAALDVDAECPSPGG